MPLRHGPRICTVCQHQAPKYTCASCRANYCTIACYKQHKKTCMVGSTSSGTTPIAGSYEPVSIQDPEVDSKLDTSAHSPDRNVALKTDQPLPDPTPLRPLTSLTWPYIPDTSAYPDPLQRDDPKPLQLHQYEAIATSSTIRTLLANPRLQSLLVNIDKLRGAEREEALQRALGVDSRRLKNDDHGVEVEEDTRAFRRLAEAVEEAVRGGREDVLGLDWD